MKLGKYITFNIITGIIFFNCHLLNGQDTTGIKNAHHVIQLEGATLFIVGTYSFNFEQRIIDGNYIKMAVNAGVGGWYLAFISKNYHGYAFPISLNNLFGSGNHHLEFDLGVRYLTFEGYSAHDISPLLPICNVGYRYQKPTNQGLIFRSYLGTSGFGIGIGKAF